MRFLVQWLAVLTFSLHSVLGCCVHHAHAGEISACCDATSRDATHGEHEGDCEHEHPAHGCEGHRPGRSHESCQDAACRYLIVAPTSPPAPDEAYSGAAPLDACHDSPTNAEFRARVRSVDESPPGPPAPLYLLHQALLT